MQIYRFSRQGEIPTRLDDFVALPDEGFVWLDFTRDEAQGWEQWPQKLAGIKVNQDHIADAQNRDHPAYFDGTDFYDMLIFRGLTAQDKKNERNLIQAKSATFFIFDRLLVSVRSSENVSFDIVKRKFCETRLRFPSTPFGLVHVVLDTMVERYFSITDELEKRLEAISDELFDPKNPFEDWRELMGYRKQAHELELLCEKSLDALDSWRRDMRQEITENQRIRLNDLREHIQRVASHSDQLQRDIEIAVQLHFASVGHRTNKIVQTLTVLSAIFFPLTLITGIYGMNFEYMPELKWQHGYFGVLLVLLSVAGGLMYFFRKRRFL